LVVMIWLPALWAGGADARPAARPAQTGTAAGLRRRWLPPPKSETPARDSTAIIGPGSRGGQCTGPSC